jgi:hypothetical protein
VHLFSPRPRISLWKCHPRLRILSFLPLVRDTSQSSLVIQITEVPNISQCSSASLNGPPINDKRNVLYVLRLCISVIPYLILNITLPVIVCSLQVLSSHHWLAAEPDYCATFIFGVWKPGGLSIKAYLVHWQAITLCKRSRIMQLLLVLL